MKLKKPILLLLPLLCLGFVTWRFNQERPGDSYVERAILAPVATALASKDQDKISDTLYEVLADDAQIKLYVEISSGPRIAYDFNKATFVKFISDTLYPLASYENNFRFVSYDTRQQKAQFFLDSSANAIEHRYGSSAKMFYTANSSCNTTLTDRDSPLRIHQLTCRVRLKMGVN